MASFLSTLKAFSHPHYITNFLLTVSFFFLKITHPLCYILFEDCFLELREWELLTFLGCIIVLKNRKQPSYRDYIGTLFMFGKLLNIFLYARQNPVYSLVYFVICLIHFVLLPEPVYSGPEAITYFRGNNLLDELERDKRVTWLIEFYAAWSPSCVNFAPLFAELSSKYSLDNLKFGKIDASRFSEVSAKFKVNTSSWTKQLPTIILFQNGKEVRRRPAISPQGRVLSKFTFTEENIVKDFELNELFLQCKKNPVKKDKRSDLNKSDGNSTNKHKEE